MTRPDPAALIIGGTVWLWAAAFAVAAIACGSVPFALAAGVLALLGGAALALFWTVPAVSEEDHFAAVAEITRPGPGNVIPLHRKGLDH